MKHFSKLGDLHRFSGLAEPENPMFSVIRCSNVCNLGEQAFTTDFYMIGLKKLLSGTIHYGRTKYDHGTGSMSFVKPRQIIEFKDLEFEEDGFLLFIHEDFLHAHHLKGEIERYTFFDYQINEALHLSPREEKLMWEVFHQIQHEYQSNVDQFSRDIILTHVSTMLQYSERFYNRQFISRKEPAGYMVGRFMEALESYVLSGFLDTKGLPNVATMAAELNLSTRYLSDLLKRETGKTAIELIHIYLIGVAKNKLAAGEDNISTIAYSLGFENLSYFSRLFKKEAGLTPIKFRQAYRSNQLHN